jgi:hypothetical protein
MSDDLLYALRLRHAPQRRKSKAYSIRIKSQYNAALLVAGHAVDESDCQVPSFFTNEKAAFLCVAMNDGLESVLFQIHPIEWVCFSSDDRQCFPVEYLGG